MDLIRFMICFSLQLPNMTNVMPLNQAPMYVITHKITPNLNESTKSSTRNNLLISVTKPFICATETLANCCTFSCDNVTSYSKYSLIQEYKQTDYIEFNQ